MHQWEKEISKWGKLAEREILTVKYWGAPKARAAALKEIKSGKKDILITSYDVFRVDTDKLNLEWNAAFFDEAHKLKGTKTKAHIAAMTLVTLKRYGLTGTVVQNSFEEMWSLLDFVRVCLNCLRKRVCGVELTLLA